jgi:hypothetical protein
MRLVSARYVRVILNPGGVAAMPGLARAVVPALCVCLRYGRRQPSGVPSKVLSPPEEVVAAAATHHSTRARCALNIS